MYTSCTSLGSNLILSRADLIACAPNCVADTEAKLPPKLPIGVRTADTIYTSFLSDIILINKVGEDRETDKDWRRFLRKSMMCQGHCILTFQRLEIIVRFRFRN